MRSPRHATLLLERRRGGGRYDGRVAVGVEKQRWAIVEMWFSAGCWQWLRSQAVSGSKSIMSAPSAVLKAMPTKSSSVCSSQPKTTNVLTPAIAP